MLSLYYIVRDVIIFMPKENQKQRGKKFKHNRDKTFTPLTKEQIERAEKIARGEKVEEEPEE